MDAVGSKEIKVAAGVYPVQAGSHPGNLNGSRGRIVGTAQANREISAAITRHVGSREQRVDAYLGRISIDVADGDLQACEVEVEFLQTQEVDVAANPDVATGLQDKPAEVGGGVG